MPIPQSYFLAQGMARQPRALESYVSMATDDKLFIAQGSRSNPGVVARASSKGLLPLLGLASAGFGLRGAADSTTRLKHCRRKPDDPLRCVLTASQLIRHYCDYLPATSLTVAFFGIRSFATSLPVHQKELSCVTRPRPNAATSARARDTHRISFVRCSGFLVSLGLRSAAPLGSAATFVEEVAPDGSTHSMIWG